MLCDWHAKPLADCMSAIIDYRGKTPKKSRMGVPLVTAKVVKGGRITGFNEFIATEYYDEWMRRGLPIAGDVVMTMEAPLGEVAQLDGTRVALGQRIITLRGKADLLDNTYLKYHLQSDYVQHQLQGRATGTTVLGIKQSELRRILLLLPPLDEQRAIARILGALDDKIELNRRMNKTLEEMAAAIFKSWFVDFDPVVAKSQGKQPFGMSPEVAALFPDSFEETEDGVVPKGWSMMSLSDICDSIFSGGTPSTSMSEYWDGGILWLSSGETRSRFIIDTERNITQQGAENSSTRFARSGATVIASAGQGHTRGQTSMLMVDSYINQSVIALLPCTQYISDAYLFFDLARRYEEFRQLSDGNSSRGSLTTAILGRLSVVIPQRDLVTEFDKLAMPALKHIRELLFQSVTLCQLRDSLLPKLLSGEIRVKQAEKMVEAAV